MHIDFTIYIPTMYPLPKVTCAFLSCKHSDRKDRGFGLTGGAFEVSTSMILYVFVHLRIINAFITHDLNMI